jgi:nicotinamide phosphoribosyltransferase
MCKKDNVAVPATLMCDFYKLSHRPQYPEGTEVIYSTWTPRSNKHFPNSDKVVAFGFQGFIKKYLIDFFNENFFSVSQAEVVEEYKRVVTSCLGDPNPDVDHIIELHELGYLPIKIMALPEGVIVPMRVPMLTICNTDSRFFWLTNYLETIMSCELWQPATSATIAWKYKQLLTKYAMETAGSTEFVPFQGHDFSMRGMAGLSSAESSGAGHLLSFVGTDTIPAISYHERYYNADITKELVGTSIPATEHSVMCAGGKSDELETYRRLINDVYPAGFVSIVSDTWDLWNTITNILPALKDDILKRDGKVVIRPDSGDPVDIVCGTLSNIRTFEGRGKYTAADQLSDFFVEITEHDDELIEWEGKVYKVSGAQEFLEHYGEHAMFDLDPVNRFNDLITGNRVGILYPVEIDTSPASKGVIELLWDLFGGTVNAEGYKELDPHIGCIYGDAITLDRCEEICKRLKAKGFASTNMVYGIGSYTYQYNTRDTFGFALKSTLCVINGKERFIFKDPATDDGTKKSNTGAVAVQNVKGKGLVCLDKLPLEHDVANLMRTILEDGELKVNDSLADIRARLG